MKGAAQLPTPFALSPAELRVVDLVADGLSNKEIGRRLTLSALTVRGHLARIGGRIGVHDRAAIVARAMLHGLIPRCALSAEHTPTVPRRKREVLVEIARGLDTAQIAAALYVSTDTVKTHIRLLFKMFGATNRAHLIRLAWDAGVLYRVPRRAVGAAA